MLMAAEVLPWRSAWVRALLELPPTLEPNGAGFSMGHQGLPSFILLPCCSREASPPEVLL